MPRVGDVLGGRFELVRELGRGGSGAVFAARDRTVNQLLAVKVIDPALVNERTSARLRREVNASRPTHPNVVTIYELYHENDLHFLAMELVDGPSLRQVLRSQGRLSVDHTIGIGRQIAAALDHLHARGLVHRDVKPGNILLAPDGAARLCDTGLARPLAEGATVTESQMVVGTPAYMPPEQGAGGELTTASDVYALGLTLHLCLTGEVPLEGDTAVATVVRRQRSRPPGPRRLCCECPRWLDRLIRRMLEPSPRARPTAAAVGAMLANGRVWPRLRRRNLAIAAAILSVLLAVVAARWAAWRRDATVRVEVLDDHVRGVDEHGETTWRRDFPGQVQTTAQSDLDGDGREETIVVTHPLGRSSVIPHASTTPSVILAVSRTGKVLTRMDPNVTVTRWSFPFPKRLQAEVGLYDLDGDGLDDLIAPCNAFNMYPTVLLVWWSSVGAWDQVFTHSGNLYASIPESVPGGRGMVFIAVNNELGVAPVVGRIRLQPPGGGLPDRRVGNLVFGISPGGSDNIVDYVLLDERLHGDGWTEGNPRLTGDGSITVQLLNRDVVIDRLGNPVPGPNAGRDLRSMRLQFLALLSRLESAEVSIAPYRDAVGASPAHDEFAPVLGEPAYRAALALTVARVLAREREQVAALSWLDDALVAAPFDALQFAKAQILAASGRLEPAMATIQSVTAEPHTTRGAFDGVVLELRIAIETRAPTVVAACVDRLSKRSGELQLRVALAAALLARAHLWWDAPGEADCSAASFTYEPAGEALAALARWRLGRRSPDDLERLRRLEEDQPDAAQEVQLALGAALLGHGDSAPALATLEGLIAALEPEARVDFFARQHLDLAQGLRATALLAEGQRQEALDAARGLLQTATPGLLPANLASEVVKSVTGGSAKTAEETHEG